MEVIINEECFYLFIIIFLFIYLFIYQGYPGFGEDWHWGLLSVRKVGIRIGG